MSDNTHMPHAADPGLSDISEQENCNVLGLSDSQTLSWAATAADMTGFRAIAAIGTFTAGSKENQEVIENLLTDSSVRDYIYQRRPETRGAALDSDDFYALASSNIELREQFAKQDSAVSDKTGDYVAGAAGGVGGAWIGNMVMAPVSALLGPLGILARLAGTLGGGLLGSNVGSDVYKKNIASEDNTNTISLLHGTLQYAAMHKRMQCAQPAAAGQDDGLDETLMRTLLALKQSNAVQKNIEEDLRTLPGCESATLEAGLRAYMQKKLYERSGGKDFEPDPEQIQLANSLVTLMNSPEYAVDDQIAVGLNSKSSNTARQYLDAVRSRQISLTELLLDPLAETERRLAYMQQLVQQQQQQRQELKQAGVALQQHGVGAQAIHGGVAMHSIPPQKIPGISPDIQLS